MKDLHITYIFDWKNNPDTSAAVKVKDQIEVWRRLGTNVEALIISPNKFKEQWAISSARVYYYKGKLGRLKARRNVNLRLKNNTSIIYRRYGIFTPSELIQICNSKTIIELNTNNDFFYKNRSIFLYCWHRIQIKMIAKHILGACAVTSEIKNLQASNLVEKTEVFTNSINLERIKFRKENRKLNSIKIVFLAGETNIWNGIEKVVLMARELNFVDFFIIGIPKSKNFPHNIHWLSPLHGETLQKKLSTMDIGISTLNLPSVGLVEGAPLKSRLYLATGLPIISGALDNALSNLQKYIFKIEFNEEASEIINLDELTEFIKINALKIVPLSSIENISAKFVEKSRLEFIANLVYSK